jgi:hypothetical protein
VIARCEADTVLAYCDGVILRQSVAGLRVLVWCVGGACARQGDVVAELLARWGDGVVAEPAWGGEARWWQRACRPR